jgi:hypothetical protein
MYVKRQALLQLLEVCIITSAGRRGVLGGAGLVPAAKLLEEGLVDEGSSVTAAPR